MCNYFKYNKLRKSSCLTAIFDVSAFAIRHDVLSDDAIKVLSHSWKGKGIDKTIEDVNVIKDPFPCCVVKNFIAGEKVNNMFGIQMVKTSSVVEFSVFKP